MQLRQIKCPARTLAVLAVALLFGIGLFGLLQSFVLC